MARRIQYTGDPVITLADVESQVMGVVADQQALVSNVIIPAVTAQCESITGAAVRAATYEEDWPASGRHGGYLDIGQAHTITSVQRLDGGEQLPLTACVLSRGARQSSLRVGGVHGVPLRITYEAGLDLAAYPSVKQWLLMQAATLYAQREVLITGSIVSRMPESLIDTLLDDIRVPPRF